MTKDEYIVQELKRLYPDKVKEIEYSYLNEYERKINSERHFREFIEKLSKL